MKKLATAIFAIALLSSIPFVAFGAEDEEFGTEAGESGVIYRKKTVMSFEDDTIDGDLTRPDGAYVESRKRVRHSNLIRIREDFRDKILDSVSSI